MAERMTIARWRGRGDVRIESGAVPVVRPDQALVRVSFVGLCGSDLEEFVSGPVVATPGVVLGHEIVGRVEQRAADGSGPDAGQRVVVDVVVGCGHCFWCARHEEGLCPDLEVLGQTRDGGLAEFVAADAARLVSVSDDLPAEHATLAEPLAVAVRALRKGGPVVGRSVVVFGGGTIGMLCAQVARSQSASHLVVVEPEAGRRALLASWGIDAVWSTDQASRSEALSELLPERGADVVLECSGRPGVAREAARTTRRGGRTVLVGVPIHEETLDLLDVILGEKTLVGSAAHLWDDDVEVAVGLLASGAVRVADLVTHRVPLVRVVDAFETLRDDPGSVIKLLVDCQIPHETSERQP